MWPFILSFLLLGVSLGAAQDWTSNTWDVIIVGAGPAGIILADRMSEAGKQTLLLEQGGPSYGITGGRQRPAWLNNTDLSRVDVPGLYKSIFADQGNLTCQNWTVSFTGCTIGGSSAINAGLFFQPPASDFDTYFPTGWKSTDVNASIGRVYSRVPSNDVYSSDGQFYLQSGYDAAKKWIVDGAGYKEVSINSVADNKIQVFGRPVFDYNKGQRGGPATTYLQTALNRSSFHLQTGVRVLRVVRNGTEATGVDFEYAVNNSIPNGKGTVSLGPNGRVILSGKCRIKERLRSKCHTNHPQVAPCNLPRSSCTLVLVILRFRPI
jgi:cellobiose dehydrogenase (acceptor)